MTDRNGCEMTFMFQFPQFILIKLQNQIQDKYPYYKLYAYGEGRYAESLGYDNFDGIPVVFVPGNGGSYKQVRSLGSVALRWSDRYSTPFHLNYFSVDFNEEYSGVNSFQLKSQTHFLKECVIKIIDLYEKRGRNVTLVLIGHSIGGLIIRTLLTLSEMKSYHNKIHLILTLATPHKYPVVPIDSQMISFYHKVDHFWRLNRNKTLNHMNVISIGGGFNDKLVLSDVTKLQTNHMNDLSAVTTAIDDVWVSMDHLCIVWCKQLVLKITRLLFDLIDVKTLKIVDNISQRNSIIRYHLMERTLGKNFPKFSIPEYITLSPNGEWSENFERIIQIYKPKVLNQIYVLMPLIKRESILIQFEGIYRNDWILACIPTQQNNITSCDKGLSLHPYVRRMPSNPHDLERRIFAGVSSDFLNKGFSHLLLAITPTVEAVNVQIDRFSSALRNKVILMPTLLESLTMFSSVNVLNIAISEETTFYNLTLIGLNQIWNTYWISLHTMSCYPSASNVGYLYLSIPWNKENQFKYVYPKKGQISQMTLKLNSPKPKDFDSSKEAILYLLIDPNCSYKLYLKPSIPQIMAQILRHFGVVLLPMIVSIMLSLLSIQISPKQSIANKSFNNSNENQFFIKNSKYFYENSTEIIKKFALISMYGLLMMSSSVFAIFSNFRERDSMTSSLTYTQIVILYAFLFLTALSITYFFQIIITSLFVSLAKVLVYLNTKFTFSQNKKISQNYDNSFTIKLLPFLSLVLLAIFGITFSSAFTFLICLFLHNIQSIYLSKKCRSLENRLGAESESSQTNLHLTLLSLLYLSSIPTIPLLLDWINLQMPAFHYGFGDPYLIPALMLTISCPMIWYQNSVIDTKISLRSERKCLSIWLKLLAIISSVICQMNYWNISFIISVSLFSVSAQQLSEWLNNRHLKRD